MPFFIRLTALYMGISALVCALFLSQCRATEPALAAEAATIARDCGARVISGDRHTKVAGTNHWSCHSYGQAVDMSGNPGCIYQHLQTWSGGYSIDYGRMGHVHISSCRAEWGVHFNHGGGRSYGRHRRHYRRR